MSLRPPTDDRAPRPAQSPLARLACLYLRSRLAGWSSVTLATLALCAWAGTAWLLSLPHSDVENGSLVPMLTLATLAAACVVGVGASSPFGDIERTVARPLPPLRLLHLGGLLAWAALVLTVALLAFDLEGARPAQPLLALLRNLAGLTGLALLSAPLIGARGTWIPPLAFLTFSTVAVHQIEDPTLWDWPFRDGADRAPGIAVLALLVVGLWLLCSRGAREPSGGR